MIIQQDLIKAPEKIEKYNEIAVKYPGELNKYFNSLSVEERIFIYYLYRASLPGNRIIADQHHRNSLEIIDLFQTVYNNQNKIIDLYGKSSEIIKFIEQCKTFLVYLWTNQSHYFKQEHTNNKRTPSKLSLDAIKKEKLIEIFTKLSEPEKVETIEKLEAVIFDENYEPTMTVSNSIEKSAVNIYSPDFTDEDYENLDPQEKSLEHAYFEVVLENNKRKVKVIPYSINGKYKKELKVSIFWLKKAYNHAKKYPQYFDKHLVQSLKYLISYFKTGKKENFDKYSIEWLQSNSKVDYNFGFIESYKDPKNIRSFFQAEATIKIIDLEKLNKILPQIEQQLPVKEEFKRDTQSSKNKGYTSINYPIFGTGDLGPMQLVAAYCLPNNEEIRANHGSKQIIYPSTKPLSELINPKLARDLSFLKQQAKWLEQKDPEGQLLLDLWNLQCILHETIGHASGKLATHTFRDGDKLTIQGKNYKVGDTIAVTNNNIKEFLSGYEQTIEELRADIIALYVSIFHLDELIEQGFLSNWTNKLTKNEIIDWLILNMAKSGIKRLINQADNTTQIAGDHARANYTIMNYLIDKGGLELIEEKLKANNKEHKVLGLQIVNQKKALNAIQELLNLVQTIKSTGDTQEAKNLIETYGIKIKNPEHVTIVKQNLKELVGNIKAFVYIYPILTPKLSENGMIEDIKATWPKDIFEQYENYSKIELSIKT